MTMTVRKRRVGAYIYLFSEKNTPYLILPCLVVRAGELDRLMSGELDKK
jgi:hypothetical protein